jgi:hypothetical protein
MRDFAADLLQEQQTPKWAEATLAGNAWATGLLPIGLLIITSF